MTWVLSVRLWNLPSWSDPHKALRTLNRTASEGGVASAVKERARELARGPLERITLPGFHLFEGPSPVSPYSWLLPEPKGDVQDLLNLWECYADQEFGARSPLLAVESDRFLLSGADFKRVFGAGRRPNEWAGPAAMMIALAQHLEGQENLSVEFTPHDRFERRKLVRVRMHVSDYLMEVTPTGVFSNMLRKHVTPSRRASDARLEGLCIPPYRSNHPLAVALLENEDTPHTTLQAANIVLRAVQLGLLHESEVRLSSGINKRAAREKAVQEAMSLLDRERDLRQLYDKLVPAGVVTSAEFRRDFGNPFRRTSAPRKETADKWMAQLYALVP